MERTVFLPNVGNVTIASTDIGAVHLYGKLRDGKLTLVGSYYDEVAALDGLEEMAVRYRGAYQDWLVVDAAPIRDVPVYSSESAGDANLLGYARNHDDARRLLRGRSAAYRLEHTGPGGAEAWVPA